MPNLPTPEDVCAVIVTYDCGDSVRETFFSVAGQVKKVLIVDNGSGGETLSVLGDLLSSGRADAELIRLETNMGIAHALNAGVRRCIDLGYSWVLTMDHDSVAAPDMVERMLTAWAAHPQREKVMLLAPRYYDVNRGADGVYVSYRGFRYKTLAFRPGVKVLEPSEVITSGNLIRTEWLAQEGGYDESLFVDCVDDDFCLRLTDRGYRILVLHDAVLRHRIGDPSVHRFLGLFDVLDTGHSAVRHYYIARNNIHMVRRYGRNRPSIAFRTVVVIIGEVIRAVSAGKDRGRNLKMIGKGAWDGLTGKLGRYR